MNRPQTILPPFAAAALLLAVSLLAGPPRAAAQGLERVFLGGFVSQGYLTTTENNFLILDSSEGSSEFHEAAISVLATPLDRLRVGMQLFARDLGNVGNNRLYLDWAYGDYRYRDWLGIRGGKVKMPMGLYNQGRDVDMLRTQILLPQALYSEAQRDFTLAVEGVDLYGNVVLQWPWELGDLDYELYSGALNVPDASVSYWGSVFHEIGYFNEWLANAHPATIHQPVGTTTRFLGIEDAEMKFPWITGGSLTWNTPLEGLRVGVSGFTGEYRGSSRLQFSINTPSQRGLLLDTAAVVKGDVKYIFVGSAEYTWRRLTLSSEYVQSDVDQGGRVSAGLYGMANYRVNDHLALGAYYSEQYLDVDDRKGEKLPPPYPDHFAWFRDLAGTVRVDLTDYWLVKLEAHRLDGSMLLSYQNNSGDFAMDLDRIWLLWALKTTFHF